jgi:hypothetical protein
LDASGAELTVTAIATGGLGSSVTYPGNGRGGDGGLASLGRVFGSSDAGGTVIVIGEAAGGNGGYSRSDLAGNGADVSLENAVAGVTEGDLTLVQRARGGSGGLSSYGQGALAGSASSVLEHTVSASRFAVTSEAFGGSGGEGDGAGTPGGRAEGIASATNDVGDVSSQVLAVGGNAGLTLSGMPAAAGGDAHARVVATAWGDGRAVRVGAPLPSSDAVEPASGAIGGRGGALDDPDTGDLAAGDGGAAVSESTGALFGDGAVTVLDFAQGGDGGTSWSDGAGGDGGSAWSTAEGSNEGLSLVEVRAHSRGGAGGYAPISAPRGSGGDATSNAVARGRGEVLAEALAEGGAGFKGGLDGAALARAMAAGGSGLASAEASSGESSFFSQSIRARAAASVSEAVVVEARTGVGGAPLAAALAESPDAFALATGNPEAEAVAAALEGHANVSAGLDAASVDEILALCEVDTHNQQDGFGSSILLTAELQLTLGSLQVEAFDQVLIGFLGSEFEGSGFDLLTFRVERNGESVVEKLFTDTAAAAAYFDDQVISVGDIGMLPTGPATLQVLFEVLTDDLGAGFGVELLMAGSPIPEPSTALLVAAGVLLFCLRARRVRRQG